MNSLLAIVQGEITKLHYVCDCIKMDPHLSLGQGNAVSHTRILDRNEDTGKGK